MDIVADTNIWLRIADDHSARHAQATESVAQLLARDARIYLVPQNLIEFWAVATRSRAANGLEWTIERTILRISEMRSKFDLLSENEGIFEKWSETVKSERISGKRVHDARLAVQLWVHSVSHLLTFNEQDFVKFCWITILRPQDLVAPKAGD
jgi:predicted nucleic acid-binding protein